MKKLDVNDLHNVVGLDETRRQLLAGLEAANEDAGSPAPPLGDAPDPGPPAPSEYEGRLTLEQALENFALTFPDGKIWDERNKKAMKKSVAKNDAKRRPFFSLGYRPGSSTTTGAALMPPTWRQPRRPPQPRGAGG